MRDRTFKLRVIQSAFEKSGLYPFNPLIVLSHLREFTTLERQLRPDDEGDNLFFEVDFKNLRTPLSPHMYEAASKYIDKSLAHSIQTGLTISPTVARVIEKREKASKTLQLSGQLAIEELYKKRQAELNKNQPKGERHIQQFGTILVGDARLRAIVRNKHEEAEIESIRV